MIRKELVSFIPEGYLMLATVYYWTLTSNLLNPIAIGLIALLIFQIVTKKLTLGLVISALFILLNLFLVLALLSELSEFSNSNKSPAELVIFGTLFVGLNLTMGIFMFYKYLKAKLKLENTNS